MDPSTVKELERLSGTRQPQVHMRAAVQNTCKRLVDGHAQQSTGTDHDSYSVKDQLDELAPDSARLLDDFDRSLEERPYIRHQKRQAPVMIDSQQTSPNVSRPKTALRSAVHCTQQ